MEMGQGFTISFLLSSKELVDDVCQIIYDNDLGGRAGFLLAVYNLLGLV